MDKKHFKLLIIEDSENDAILVVRQFKKSNIDIDYLRVETTLNLRNALENKEWDFIICDYNLPQMTVFDALNTLSELDLDLPFIVVSGSLGEEKAVATMKAGAHDYVMKENLTRLVPVVERELNEADLRRRQKQTEAELKTSQANYQEIFNTVNDAIFLINPSSGAIIDANIAASEYTGYSNQELIGINIEEICMVEILKSGSESNKWFDEVIKNEPQILEWTVRQKSGEVLIAELSIKRASIGSAEIILAVSRDLTDRKRINAALTMSEQRFRSIVENSHEGISIIDNNFQVQYANHILANLTGSSREELVGQDFRSFLHPETEKFLTEMFVKRMKGESVPDSYELDLKLKNGKERRVLINVSIISGTDGERQSVAQILDITDRYLSEIELRESEKKYRQLVENANEAIFIIQNNKFKFNNEKTLELFECDKKEILEINFEEFIYPADIDKFSVVQSLKDGESELFYQAVRILTRENVMKWVEAHRINIKYNQNNASLFFIRDITQQRKLEDQLKIAQKMEAIGTLAGGIAHDFNNILSPIIGYTELAMDDLDEETRSYSNLTQVYKAGNRARDLVQQILTFSRQSEQEPRPLQLHVIINEALKLLRASIPSTICFNIELDKDCPPVIADPTQIHQIIMNLCTNAYQAMGDTGGTMGIKLAKLQLVEDDTNERLPLDPGSYVALSITDTGCGMENTTLQRIFDPFFTTKDKGLGTGMGLAVVHGIIKEHKGHIEVYSEPGQGSTFRVYFPTHRIDKLAEDATSNTQVIGGDEHILLVDDESAIVHLTTKILEHLGYKVTAFSNSSDALHFIEKNPKDIDLVITDQIMPEMTGDKLSRKIHEIRPDLPILLCTGFSDFIDKEQAIKIGIQDIIMKPVLRSDLANAIRKILNKE